MVNPNTKKPAAEAATPPPTPVRPTEIENILPPAPPQSEVAATSEQESPTGEEMPPIPPSDTEVASTIIAEPSGQEIPYDTIVNSSCPNLINTITRKYDIIYAPIGGKISDTRASGGFYYAPQYHLVPVFIQNQPTDKKVLIILIDDLTTINRANFNLVQRNPNIDFIFINKRINISLYENCILTELCDIIQFIFDVAKKMDVPSNYVMVCNYIRFIIPNRDESYIEENILNTLKKINRDPPSMDEHDYYKNSIYCWIGYKKSLHNIIYKIDNEKNATLEYCITEFMQRNMSNNSYLNNKIITESNFREFTILCIKRHFDYFYFLDNYMECSDKITCSIDIILRNWGFRGGSRRRRTRRTKQKKKRTRRRIYK